MDALPPPPAARITASPSPAKGIAGTTYFRASGDPGPAHQINIGSGNNQKAEAAIMAMPSATRVGTLKTRQMPLAICRFTKAEARRLIDGRFN